MATHACNPSYWRGRGRESKSMQVKLVRSCLKHKAQTKGLGTWLKDGVVA
jgi:hypothetical protein